MTVLGIFSVVALGAALYVGVSTQTDLLGNRRDLNILTLLRNTHVMSSSNDSVSVQLNEYLDRSESKLAAGGAVQDSAMVNLYYNLATDFYEYGWSQSFHFAPRLETETHEQSLTRHERFLADQIGIKPATKVVDVGCGVGGPARTIASYTQAHITGVTINDYQVERGRNHTQMAGLSGLVTHMQMDFTKLTFDEATFDFAYAIEATCHATDLYNVYSQVYKVLKPGGVFGTYEWISTPKYDSNKAEHANIMRLIEVGSGLPPMHTYADVQVAAAKAGFVIQSDMDLAIAPHATTKDSLTWWSKLDMSSFSISLTHAFTWVMESVGLAPVGSTATHNTLIKAVDGLVPGGKTGIFTPMHLFIMVKPTNEPASAF